jgi:hypothetical protein
VPAKHPILEHNAWGTRSCPEVIRKGEMPRTIPVYQKWTVFLWSTGGGRICIGKCSTITAGVHRTSKLRSGSLTLFPFPSNEWPAVWQTRKRRENVSSFAASYVFTCQVAKTKNLAIAILSCGTVYGLLSKDHCPCQHMAKAT